MGGEGDGELLWGAMGHRLRRGWRRGLLFHLTGAFSEAEALGCPYSEARHIMRHPQVRRELHRLLEEATHRLSQRLRQG
jgi:hypothetical protein